MKNCDNSICLTFNPMVSVIIPSYNRIDTIGQTIDSILAQKCDFPFEIIIGDDKSEDDVRELLISYQKKYPDQIRLFLHKENMGLGANWAFCVQQCKGKYIANCDNDDYWHNTDKLQLQVDYLENYQKTGVCYTNHIDYFEKSNKKIERKVSENTFDLPLYKAIFSGKFIFCNSTIMYRKELLLKQINLNDYIKLKFTLQDWMTLLILSKYTEFHCIPITTTTLRIDNASITRPSSFEIIKQRMKNEEECYKYVCKLFPDDLVYENIEYQKYTYNVFLNFAYLNNNYKIAHEYGLLLLKFGRKQLKVFFSLFKLSFFLYSKWFVWTQKFKF